MHKHPMQEWISIITDALQIIKQRWRMDIEIKEEQNNGHTVHKTIHKQESVVSRQQDTGSRKIMLL